MSTTPSIQSNKAMQMAIFQGHLPGAEAAVLAGADLGGEFSTGESYLEMAASQASLAMIQKLRALGADPNRRSSTGIAPVHQAAWMGYLNCLMAMGGDLRLRDSKSRTPLMLAATGSDDAESVRWLIDGGSELDALCSSGATALIYAAQSNARSTLEILVGRGAKVDIQDKDGMTALARACNSGCVEAANYLMEVGADPMLRDRLGRTASMVAKAKGHLSLSKAIFKVEKIWLERSELLEASGGERTLPARAEAARL